MDAAACSPQVIDTVWLRNSPFLAGQQQVNWLADVRSPPRHSASAFWPRLPRPTRLMHMRAVAKRRALAGSLAVGACAVPAHRLSLLLFKPRARRLLPRRLLWPGSPPGRCCLRQPAPAPSRWRRGPGPGHALCSLAAHLSASFLPLTAPLPHPPPPLPIAALQISIADLLLSCEIEQLCLLDAASQVAPGAKGQGSGKGALPLPTVG